MIDYENPIIEQHYLFVFVKGGHFTIYLTNLISSKLISEIVSSGNTVFLCINAAQV